MLILYLILQEHTVVHICILDCIRNDWNSDGNQSVVCYFNCYVVHVEEKPFGKYLWMFWGRMQSQSIMQKEVQALCYLKFLYNSKQWNLFRGSCFGYYVDFTGDGSQSDLYHVEWLYDQQYCIPPRSHVRPHLVAINVSMDSNGYTIWWWGDKSLQIVPQCAILKGQGTVCFLWVEKRKESKSILCITP